VAAVETVGLIEEAVELLIRHPLIGRPIEHGLRELVISRGRTGYVALYSFEEDQDAVLVLAIRHQREAGYLGQDDD
jgi:plasmid stabilization system protein ParE